MTFSLPVSGGCLNPAVGLAFNMTQLFDYGGIGIKWIWLYLLIPSLGGICATLFHEAVFKKAMESSHINMDDVEHNENLL